jgi:hypothetical protein
LITIDAMTDETGHQLPNIIYPGLDRGELVDWVERFYGEYYFRPRVIWRVVRKAIFDSTERKRLSKEAREYMACAPSGRSSWPPSARRMPWPPSRPAPVTSPSERKHLFRSRRECPHGAFAF